MLLYKELLKLGLKENEAKVYLALLELGQANIQEITDKSKVKRTSVYNAIEDLKENDLIILTKKKKRNIYIAKEPAKILEQLENRKKFLEGILPELNSIVNIGRKKPKITFYEGVEGIKKVYEDALKIENSEILSWVTGEVLTALSDRYLEEVYKIRLKNKILAKVLGPKTKELEKFKAQDEKLLRKTKLIDKEIFNMEVEIAIYQPYKISIMSPKDMMAVIIESKPIYNSVKNIFQLIWKIY